MPSMIVRFLLVQFVRYAASVQMFGVVVLQAGWVLLALATWGHSADGGLVAVTRPVMRVLQWLGGIGADGRGDENTIFLAWVKASFVIYLLLAAWRHVRGPRPPWTWWRIVAVSTAIAFAGYLLAMWPSSAARPADLAFATTTFTVATAIATAWAVAASRLGEWVVARIERAPATV